MAERKPDEYGSVEHQAMELVVKLQGEAHQAEHAAKGCDVRLARDTKEFYEAKAQVRRRAAEALVREFGLEDSNG